MLLPEIQEEQMPHRFGAFHRLPCPECSGEMLVTRRSPAEGLEQTHERQILTCGGCNTENARVVDVGGVELVQPSENL